MRVKLDIPLRIEEICHAIGADIPENIDITSEIYAISTDTRECKEGDLFIALKGESESGEKYANDAFSKKCFVISSSGKEDFICVNDTAEALLKISSVYKEKISPNYTIAVTGSVGKSTTVKFLSMILREEYRVHSTIGNFNNHIGLPLTILSMPRGTDVLIVEMGMNHMHEISLLSKCAKPNLGIITIIGTAHMGNLGSREKIAQAKLEILDGMKDGCMIIPCEEPLLSGIENGLYVGRNSSLSDFSLDDNESGSYSFRSGSKTIENIDFFDHREHLLYDLAFAISAADVLGLSGQKIIKGVRAITAIDLRQRFIVLKDFTIFDDSYNASLESVSADLEFISTSGRPTGAFIGDILELGDDAAGIHEKIGRLAATLKIDHLYLYGKYSEHIAHGAICSGMPKNQIYINSHLEFPWISIEHIKKNHSENEIILFKASHKLRLDKIADMIKNEERNDNGHL